MFHDLGHFLLHKCWNDLDMIEEAGKLTHVYLFQMVVIKGSYCHFKCQHFSTMVEETRYDVVHALDIPCTTRMLAECVEYHMQCLSTFSFLITEERLVRECPRGVLLDLSFIDFIPCLRLYSFIQLFAPIEVNRLVCLLFYKLKPMPSVDADEHVVTIWLSLAIAVREGSQRSHIIQSRLSSLVVQRCSRLPWTSV